MKFYESTAEEYLSAMDKYNLHNELKPLYDDMFPKSLNTFENLINSL